MLIINLYIYIHTHIISASERPPCQIYVCVYIYIYIYIYIYTHTRTHNCMGHAVAQMVEALRYKPEGLGFDSRWYHWNFFIDIILPVALWPWC